MVFFQFAFEFVLINFFGSLLNESNVWPSLSLSLSLNSMRTGLGLLYYIALHTILNFTLSRLMVSINSPLSSKSLWDFSSLLKRSSRGASLLKRSPRGTSLPKRSFRVLVYPRGPLGVLFSRPGHGWAWLSFANSGLSSGSSFFFQVSAVMGSSVGGLLLAR